MDRRSLLKFLGLAPALSLAGAALANPAPAKPVARLAKPLTIPVKVEWAPLPLASIATEGAKSGQVLMMTADGVRWVTLSGDVTGPAGANTVVALTGKS